MIERLRTWWQLWFTYYNWCACGHERDLHEHYTRSLHCGACTTAVCQRFKPDKSIKPGDFGQPRIRSSG